MRKNLFILIILLTISVLPSMTFGSSSIYGEYENFNELYDAYMEAVD